MPVLEKPDIPDERIIDRILDEYGLSVEQTEFLPLGPDRNSASYRAVTDDQTPYFVKLRFDNFGETSVDLPKFLNNPGITQVMAPLPTESGKLWADLEPFRLNLYPFVNGRNGYEVELSYHHWIEFGAILRRIHTAVSPPELISRIQRELYSPLLRRSVETLLERVSEDVFDDPISLRCSVFLSSKRDEIRDIVGRAARLARTLQTRSMDFVVCHSDIHAGNLLIGVNNALYVVDWDDPILAPKERDLMFVGAA